jgi:hypothetical protein
MWFGKLGVEFNGEAAAGHGIIEPAKGLQRQGEIIVVFGNGGTDFNGLAEKFSSRIVTPELMRDDAEKPQGIGVVAILRKYLLIKRGGLLKAP